MDGKSDSNCAVGFPPIVGDTPHCLILGSMPGIKSLQDQQYYAHPRNAFWPILASVCGFSLQLDYAERCQQLQRHHIAVWDVLQSCQRKGSLDSDIKAESIVPNDFDTFFTSYPSVRHVFFNGAKAATVFKKVAVPEQIKLTQLPSTSPAHAAVSFEQKLTLWQQALIPSLL